MNLFAPIILLIFNADPRFDAAVTARLEEPLSVVLALPETARLFRVVVPEAGYLKVRHGTLSESRLRPRFRFFSSDGALLGEGTDQRVFGPTTVYVELTDRGGRFHEESFSLHFRHLPEFDILEPNDHPRLASRVELGSWIPIGLFPAGDVDHLRVELLDEGYLTYEWRSVPKGWKPVVSLVDSEGKPLVSDAGVYRLRRGSHRLAIRESGGRAADCQIWLRLRRIPEMDELESEDPVEVDIGSAHAISIFPGQETDVLSVTPAQTGMLHARFWGVPDAVSLRVDWNGRGPPLEAKLNAGVAVRAGEQVTLELSDRRGTGSPVPFTVMLELEPTTDGAEPNDARRDATPLTPGDTVRIQLHPQGDVDWFRFGVADPGTLSVRAHDDAAFRADDDVLLKIELFDADGTPLFGFPQAGKDVRRTCHLAGGEYFLSVRSTRTSRLAFGLHVDFLSDSAVPSPPLVTNGLGFTVVALETSPDELDELRVLCARSRVSLVEVDAVESLVEDLEGAIEDSRDQPGLENGPDPGDRSETAPTKHGSTGGLLGIVALTLAAAAGYWFRRRCHGLARHPSH